MCRYVQSLIADEVDSGIPAERIVVSGFSQGGAVALLALREPVKLAGVLGLSCYLPLANAPLIVSPENKATPVLMCHGTADPVVMFQYGELSSQKLRGAGANLEFEQYSGLQHAVHPQELEKVASFWQRCLA